MLHHVHIKSFGIIQSQSLTVKSHLTTITGETGAGKSILMDAILFALNLPTRRSRDLKPDTSVTLVFDMPEDHPIHTWCQENGLEPSEEYIIRRSATPPLRTRCYLNDQPISLHHMKSLAPLLIQITGQHSHQYLTQAKTQRDIVDHFGHHLDLKQQVSDAFMHWQDQHNKLEELNAKASQQADQLTLLAYQCEELDTLAIQEDEIEQLLSADKQFQHQETLRHHLSQLNLVLDQLSPSLSQHDLTQWQTIFPSLNHCTEMQSQLNILITELSHELRNIESHLLDDPATHQKQQDRLSLCHDLARKHRVDIRSLYQHHQKLITEQKALHQISHDIESCQQATEQAHQEYLKLAKKLSQSRQKAAQKLSNTLNEELSNIGMPHGVVAVKVTPSESAKSHGLDDLTLWIQTNPGQPMAPIADCVSGGELSRLSLLIKTLTPPVHATSLIFDEVDTGIGGSVANIIAQLLHKASTYQALCITHLPQVAACGKQQWHVTKYQSQHQTFTEIKPLVPSERITQLACLMSGLSPSKSSKQEAKALLNQWHELETESFH